MCAIIKIQKGKEIKTMIIYRITWRERDVATWLGGSNEGLYYTAEKFFLREEDAHAFARTIMGATFSKITVE
jgi:hypothetical protein